MFQGFPCDCVHDRHGPVVDERSGESSLVCLLGDYVNLLVAYAVSSNGDPRSVRIFFVGPILAHNFGVCDLVAAVVADIFMLDDLESISSLNALLSGAFRALIYALARASQFIGI